jgi:hypothetical protein
MAMHVKLARGKSVGVLEPAFINTRPEYREWRDLAPSLYNSTLKHSLRVFVRAYVDGCISIRTCMTNPDLPENLKSKPKTGAVTHLVILLESQICERIFVPFK